MNVSNHLFSNITTLSLISGVARHPGMHDGVILTLHWAADHAVL